MQPADLDSSAPAGQSSIATQSQNRLSSSHSPRGPVVDHHHQATSTSTDGTAAAAATSHTASPHPTPAKAQPGRAISSSSPAAIAHAYFAGPALTGALTDSPVKTKMLFSDLYKSTKSPLARLRQPSHPASGPAAPDFDADLVSRDKAKQKDAIKRFLTERIRNDWEFKWPPESEASVPEKSEPEVAVPNPETPSNQEPNPDTPATETSADDLDVKQTDQEDDAASVYSTVSEDPIHFRPRAEWLSDLSEDEHDEPVSPSAYRFETPDAVGNTLTATEQARSARRRRATRAEMEWNNGLACFNARRDAWTGAKVARVRPKTPAPVATSPTKARRLSLWRLSTSTSAPTSPTGSAGTPGPLSPSLTRTSGDTTAVSTSDTEAKEGKPKPAPASYRVETLLPIPPPLLPPANPMRASITPSNYPSIYDKIVVHSMTPACPINLGDVISACVVGWKRDGEWPPRANEVPPVVAVRKKRKDSGAESRKADTGRRMSFNFLGRKQSVGSASVPGSPSQPRKEEDSNNTKGVRRSLQRVLGLGHERTGSNASNNGNAAG
ncbi:Uu.00g063590.m01.CDS01 [Anthostomella pinea]|uniref:Uu.00g063590.m01.CDS01 n=1 Tax=Anthostomella pinea TaxID=933095 RepID=A0AAI8VTF7_9PEZI|nr:Uu.00g063590.m01.CDS01 [Anthostomella pinea]